LRGGLAGEGRKRRARHGGLIDLIGAAIYRRDGWSR
jgi:hypothetical protein